MLTATTSRTLFPSAVSRPVGATPRERLRALARSTFWLDVYSLMRTPVLQGTIFGQEKWGGDILIVSALCLRGEVAEVPERLFSYRCFMDKSAEDIAHLINPAGSVAVSWIGLTLEILKNIWRAPLGLAERAGLSLMFISEFCIRNATVNGYIHEEGLGGMRHALAHGRYRSALAIAALAALISPATHKTLARFIAVSYRSCKNGTLARSAGHARNEVNAQTRRRFSITRLEAWPPLILVP